ncbi:MAG: AbrB/MazE/SpoVT family DNA-binding domain-containing protein [Blastocatellia bacterium]
MQSQIQKWGNSLALRIPKAFAKEAKIEQGINVEVKLVEGSIVITPITPNKYNLEDLLSQITKDNVHEEINTGEAVGKEVW